MLMGTAKRHPHTSDLKPQRDQLELNCRGRLGTVCMEQSPPSRSDQRSCNRACACRTFMIVLALLLLIESCATDEGPVLSGIYQTWDDVITRWIGQQKTDLYYELGPPQFHKEAQDGTEELVWDMTLPSLPGQAELYDSLPLYGGVDCRLFFFADAREVIQSGRREGCE